MSGGRLLVTGARGFVGRHVIRAALDSGFEVHATARRVPEGGETGNVTWHAADLLGIGEPARLIAAVKPTHLLHAAWETTHGSYWSSLENVRWLASTAMLAHAFAEAGGTRFVFAGTCAEYDWSQAVIVEDLTPMRPKTLYGSCKLAVHDLLQAMSRRGDFTSATGRIFFAYGPYENPRRLIPYACRTIATDETVVLSNGRKIRDFLHIDDVARAFVVLLNSSLCGPVNIGMGEPVRLSEIVEMLGAGQSRPIRMGASSERADEPCVIVPDIARLISLGWRPQIELEAGLKQTYAWWLEQAYAGK